MGKAIIPYTDEEIADIEQKIKLFYCLEIPLWDYDNFQTWGLEEVDWSRIPASVIKKWAENKAAPHLRGAAMVACRYAEELHLGLIQNGLQDNVQLVYLKAIDACERNDIPTETIDRWADSPDSRFRRAAMKVCRCISCKPNAVDKDDLHKTMPWNIIYKGMTDSNEEVRVEARRSFNSWKSNDWVTKELPDQWFTDENPEIRKVAMELCTGRSDVPWEIIERGLQDPMEEVREAAKAICLG